MKLTLFIVLIALIITSCSQNQRNSETQTLLVSVIPTDTTVNGLYLVGYTFKNGDLVSTDTITKEVHWYTDTIQFDNGDFKIDRKYLAWDEDALVYKNRFIIKGGDYSLDALVYDLKKKKLLIARPDLNFFKTSGDSVIYNYRSKINTRYVDPQYVKPRYLFCNLKNGKSSDIEKKNYRCLLGLQSPNGELALIDKSFGDEYSDEVNWKIYLEDTNGNVDLIVDDAGNGVVMSTRSSFSSKVPMHWINDHQFLYAKYKNCSGPRIGEDPYEYKKRYSLATICLFDIHSKTEIVIGKTDSLKGAISPSYFYDIGKDSLGFGHEGTNYKVNLKTQSIKKISDYACGSSFSTFYDSTSKANVFKYNDSLIGIIKHAGYSLAATDNYLATMFEDSFSYKNPAFNQKHLKELRPAGIKVWSLKNGEWITIKSENISTIIDWIDNYSF